MTELVRLLDTTEDGLERALLGAVLAESPEPAALRDAALALGLTATTAAALVTALPAAASAVGAPTTAGAAGVAVPTVVAPSLATTTATVASLATLGKGLVGGALVSFLALSTVDQTLGSASQPGASPPAATTMVAGRKPSLAAPGRLSSPPEAPLPTPPEPPRAASSAEGSSRRVAAPVLVEPSPAPARAAPGSANFEAEAPTRAPVVASTDASLAAETRLLESARGALQAGDTGAARQALDQYRSSKPSAVLSHEAALLEVRLLLATGQRAAAAEHARRIIAQHPRIAHAESLRRLAAEP